MSDWFEHFGFAEVGDDLLMGAYPQDAEDVAALRGAGVTRVFNLVQDIEYDPGARDACVAALAEAGHRGAARRARRLRQPAARPDRGVGAGRAGVARRGRARVRALPRGLAALGGGRRGDRRRCARASSRGRRSSILRERKPTANPLSHQRADLLDWWERRARV